MSRPIRLGGQPSVDLNLTSGDTAPAAPPPAAEVGPNEDPISSSPDPAVVVPRRQTAGQLWASGLTGESSGPPFPSLPVSRADLFWSDVANRVFFFGRAASQVTQVLDANNWLRTLGANLAMLLMVVLLSVAVDPSPVRDGLTHLPSVVGEPAEAIVSSTVGRMVAFAAGLSATRRTVAVWQRRRLTKKNPAAESTAAQPTGDTL